MSVNLRYPNITGRSGKEQITQIKSYLHQLVDHMNYELPTLKTESESKQEETSKAYDVQGGTMSYYELRSLIIQQLQEVEDLFDKLSAKMEAEYVKNTELSDAIDEALAKATASGDFKGDKGDPGKDGYTPIKGKDYFTEGEISTIAADAAGKITFTLDESGNLYYELEE